MTLIEKLEKKKMKWLSVKKYKPPFDKSILIKDEVNYQGFAYLCSEYGWRDSWSDICLEDRNTITHFCILDPIEIEEE